MMKFLFFSVILLFTECGGKKNLTPKKYIIKNKVSSEMYSKDSTQIISVLNKMLNKNVQPFKPSKHFDSKTIIYLDTILYSPDKLRMVIMVISKNNADKLEYGNNGKSFFYNGNFLICQRKSESSKILVYDYSSYNLAHYYDYLEVQKRLHEYCFQELSLERFEGEKIYNVDDFRFWDSSMFEWIVAHSNATLQTEN